MSENERQLIKLACNGSVAAFEKLTGRHQKRVYNLMLKTCNNEFEASQLAQEVFVKAFDSLVSGADDGCYVLNIYRIASDISRQTVCKSKKIS